MTHPDKAPMTDRDMETIMGNLLRYGVLLSALIVIIGGTLYLIQHGHQSPQYKAFHGEPRRLREIKGIWETMMQGKGRSVIQLGLLVLIATPVARIIFSVLGYLREKDYLYVLITCIVLAIILSGL